MELEEFSAILILFIGCFDQGFDFSDSHFMDTVGTYSNKQYILFGMARNPINAKALQCAC